MPTLIKYNTFTEALAYNLTNEEQEILGYVENTASSNMRVHNKKFTNTINSIVNIHPNFNFHSTGILETEYNPSFNKCYSFPDSYLYGYNMFKETKTPVYNKDKNTPLSDYLYDTKIDLSKNSNSDSFYSVYHYGVLINSYISYDKWFSNYQNRGMVNYRLVFGNYLFDDHTDRSYWCYNQYLTKDYFLSKSLFHSRLVQENTTSYYYEKFKDFRWMNNKKILIRGNILDNIIYDYSNLIPEGSIFFIVNSVELKEKLEAQLPTIREKVKTLEGCKEVYTALGLSPNNTNIAFAYRSQDYMYITSSNVQLSLLNFKDEGEDYPLDESGYIAWNKIDYRKKYKHYLGAAKLNPRFVHQFTSMFYTPMKKFTNKPENTQGVPYQITLNKYLYKSTSNEGILTIILGHTIIDGVTYPDELGAISSANDYIGIVDNKDGTYKISFKDTTQVREDRLFVKIKNTFTEVWSTLYYDLDFVLENVKETLRINNDLYEKNVSSCNTISGYIRYSRDTEFTETELANINQANLDNVISYINQNFYTITKPNIEPIEFLSAKAFGDTINLTHKGKSLDRSGNATHVGTHIYNFKSKLNNLDKNLTIKINADIFNNPKPIDPGTGAPADPIRGGGSGGGGAGGAGGAGGNGGGVTIIIRDPEKPVEEPTEEQPKYECLNATADKDGYVKLSDVFDIATLSITVLDPLIPIGTCSHNYRDAYVYVKASPDASWTGDQTVTSCNSTFTAYFRDSYQSHYGQLWTTAEYLMPKAKTTITYKIRRKGTNEKYITIGSHTYSKYRQSFILYTAGQTETPTIQGGDDNSIPYINEEKEFGKLKYQTEINDEEKNETKSLLEGINFNNPKDTSNLKYKMIYPGKGLKDVYAQIDFKGIPLCVYFKALTKEEYAAKYQDPKLFDNNYKTNLTPDETDGTYNLTSDYLYFPKLNNLSKPVPYGTYTYNVELTDNTGNVYKSPNSDYKVTRQTDTPYLRVTYPTENFDKTKIKTIKVNVEKFVDSTGGIVYEKPLEEVQNENTTS